MNRTRLFKLQLLLTGVFCTVTVMNGGLRAQTAALPAVVHFTVTQAPAGEVYLNWAVQRPEAGVLYTVQRSADGVFFSTVGTVHAQESADFCFTDSFPATAGRVWYHILQSNAAGATAITPMRCLAPVAVKRLETAVITAPARKAAIGKTAVIKP